MTSTTRTRSRVPAIAAALTLAGVGTVLAQVAQQGVPAGPSPAERAITYRQSLMRVVGGNFQPLGAFAQGRQEWKADEVARRARHLAAIADLVPHAFPEVSKDGNTKAKSEIWAERAEFDKLAKQFVEHATQLGAVAAKDSSTATEALKAAVATLGEDCKSCHDRFRAK
jgi:cytochrome c556